VPKYDFRCDACGSVFELTRPFSQSDLPATCPHDDASATRLFSPPLDLLMYRREPIVDTRPLTIPPGALSCHDHGPPAQAAVADRDAHRGSDGRRSESRWHAHGYEPAPGGAGQPDPHRGEAEDGGHGHADGHGHAHAHGHHHGHGHGHDH
jgi:putative FmdB family regulatory protein